MAEPWQVSIPMVIQGSSTAVLAGTSLTCLALYLPALLILPISHQDIFFWEVQALSVYAHCYKVRNSLGCQGRVKVFPALFLWQLSFQVLIPQPTNSVLNGVSTACWQEHLRCPYGLGREQQETAIFLRVWHSTCSSLHVFSLGLPGSQPKLCL